MIEISSIDRHKQIEYNKDININKNKMIELIVAMFIQVKTPEYYPIFPTQEIREEVKEQPIEWSVAEVSAYTASVEECDSTPTITASNKKVKRGYVAMNGVKFGTKIEIEGLGMFEVQDRMNRRYKNNIDVYMESKSEALAFGRKDMKYRYLTD